MNISNLILISDHPHDFLDLTNIVEANRIELSLPKSIAAGLLLLRTDPADAIIVDGLHTDPEPAATVRNVRKMKPNVPILLIHDPAHEEFVGPAARAGARGFLQRPFSPDQVIPELEQTIDAFARERDHTRTEIQNATSGIASGVTHYVNNLLEGVIGRASILATHSDLSANLYRDLRAILEDGKQIANLMNRLSYLGDLELQRREEVHLTTSLQSAVRTVGSKRARRIRLECMFDEDPVIQGSASDVTEMFMELLNNACDVSDAESLIHVRASLQTIDDRGQLSVSIMDKGRGLENQDVERLFQPFYSSSRSGGRGLGLPIARAIARRLDGTVALRPGPTGSTETLITLPITTSVEKKPIAHVTEVSEPMNPQQVLVIDDMPVVLEMISRMAAKATSQNVVSVTNGPDAVDFARKPENELSMILLDLGLQGTKGTVVYEQIREHRPRVPILFISGFSSDPDLADILSSDNNARFLQKPFDLAQLREAIQMWQPA